MNWNRAKNYTILFLFILNAVLLILNINLSRSYRSANEDSVKILLENDRIALNCEVPGGLKPMSQLRIPNYEYDLKKLQESFFTNRENVKRTAELGKTIFMSDAEILTVEKDIVTYTSANGIRYDTQKEAIKECNAYVSRLEKAFGKFALDTVTEYTDYLEIRYIGQFKGEKIFNNYAAFIIETGNALSIEFSYGAPDGFKERKLEICSASDALLLFMAEIRKIYDEDVSVNIERIDLGYYKDGLDTANALPCYRIIVSIDGYAEHFYINAYSNTLIG